MVNLQQPSHREGSRLLLVDSSVLPEVFRRRLFGPLPRLYSSLAVTCQYLRSRFRN